MHQSISRGNFVWVMFYGREEGKGLLFVCSYSYLLKLNNLNAWSCSYEMNKNGVRISMVLYVIYIYETNEATADNL